MSIFKNVIYWFLSDFIFALQREYEINPHVRFVFIIFWNYFILLFGLILIFVLQREYESNTSTRTLCAFYIIYY